MMTLILPVSKEKQTFQIIYKVNIFNPEFFFAGIYSVYHLWNIYCAFASVT
jgi:hypothetical protein